MNENPHNQLKEIRSLMERSTRFMSLSGWTGIMAGIYSLIGATAAYWVVYKMNFDLAEIPIQVDTYATDRPMHYNYPNGIFDLFSEKNLYLLFIALSVILLSSITAFYQSSVKAKKQGVTLWNSTTKRLFVQVAIPLVTGGVFCLALMMYGHAGLIAPAMLIFYGLALLNGSKYTLKEFHSLALCEIGLGIISLLFVGYGLFFWAMGFGVLHIIYGIMMQKRYN
jgi:hypothetical protein